MRQAISGCTSNSIHNYLVVAKRIQDWYAEFTHTYKIN